MKANHLTFDQLASQYCERQLQTPGGLRETLKSKITQFQPTAFVLLECKMMDSSMLGSLTILPVGPNNTHKSVEQAASHPISPRGLASDMSVVVGWVAAEEI